MKNNLIILLLFVIGFAAKAQVVAPQASAAGSVSTVVGLTTVKIDYSRPHMKGRKIFGPDASYVTPFDQIWRTGANSGTKISFSDDVTVEGIKVPKGDYLIFSWPGASEWSISLYKDLTLGGNTSKYDVANEVAKFKVKPSTLAEKVETFTINISDLSDDYKSAKVQIAWENTSVKFGVTVDFDAKVMKSIEDNTKINPNNLYQAATYFYDNGKDLKQALVWATTAADANPKAYWVLHLKAKIQKGLGDKAGAITTATKSLDISKEEGDKAYQKLNDDLIKSIK